MIERYGSGSVELEGMGVEIELKMEFRRMEINRLGGEGRME